MNCGSDIFFRFLAQTYDIPGDNQELRTKYVGTIINQ